MNTVSIDSDPLPPPDAVGGVVDDIEEMFKQGFQFLGQGLKNAVEDSNNERCSGNCLFKWPIGGE